MKGEQAVNRFDQKEKPFYMRVQEEEIAQMNETADAIDANSLNSNRLGAQAVVNDARHAVGERYKEDAEACLEEVKSEHFINETR